jgi:Lrp/AsnC family leucine-responsive transcriptional regulator
MIGEPGYLLRIVIPDLRAYKNFLKNLLTSFTGALNIRGSFAFNRAKHPTVLPLNHLKNA